MKGWEAQTPLGVQAVFKVWEQLSETPSPDQGGLGNSACQGSHTPASHSWGLGPQSALTRTLSHSSRGSQPPQRPEGAWFRRMRTH